MPIIECERCGREFDTETADGWCTKTDCGRYNYYHGGETQCPYLDCRAVVANPASDYCTTCGRPLDGSGDGKTIGDSGDSPDPTDTCPECDASVDADQSYCTSCGAELGSSTPTCPECDERVGPTDAYCTSCGAELDTADTIDLVLDCSPERIDIPDGGTLGAGLREIAMDRGVDRDDALHIHRDHARFERRNGAVYVTHVGRNDLRVNGTTLDPGETTELAVGDTVEFANALEGELKPAPE